MEGTLAERIAMGGPGITMVIGAEDHNILFANKLFSTHLGYDVAEARGMNFFDLLDPYECDRLYRQLAAIGGDLQLTQDFVVYRLRTSSGEMKPFYVYVSGADVYGTGTLSGYQFFMIPDRNGWNMPYTSADTKALFLRHFEAEGYGTFEWIMDVDKVFWSSGVYRIYEVDPDVRDITHNFVRRFVHPQDRERVIGVTRDAMGEYKDVDIEFRIITARNTIKIIHSLGRIIKDSDGKPVKYIGSVRDVSGQRAIEEHLKSKMEELRRSNSELEDFAYAASHDLQEPLRKITTFGDRLLEKYKDVLAGEGEMYLSRMNASAENMRLLINGLLDFSRITQTQAPFAQVSLSLVIKQVMTDLELKIEETGTVIEFGVLPVVDAVATHMKQLFTNLISNAMKFQKPGVPPVIRISSQPLDEDELQLQGLPARKNYHKVTVVDNGIGFEAQYANRIFQVFQRLHGKSEYPGSGVGLAICKKIMEHHKGVIYAESSKGTGARFIIIIPDRQ
ncbi:PAS domain-containing sensor histidine kinase [Nemorincola caseinilytica]